MHARALKGTRDLARAAVPTGKYVGTHTGRVVVRASGSFTIRTAHNLVTTRHTNFHLLQRADGYAYTTHPEKPSRPLLRRTAPEGRNAFPPV
ncbi:hypothetical protein [Streptomyces sp. ME19-01-6]|uniref:hypothetical protein n=1 Tax=Streptomyces sp. ME19-01-6 TaxID=3028686 RepID=UPI0029A57162|nr:hypothetical protein [Streptomyces sp. ME19-01-6]MDX3230740.1 hypothetical protein [Streptomyces sp. ME19-01-6]